MISEPKPDETELKKSRSQADKFKPKFASKVDLSFKCPVLYFCLESDSTINIKCTARFPLSKHAAARHSQDDNADQTPPPANRKINTDIVKAKVQEAVYDDQIANDLIGKMTAILKQRKN